MHKFKKQFGQNFLRSNRFPQKMVDYLDINEEDTIIEVGPGEGILTNLLIRTGAKVVSIEIDYTLLPKLIKRFNEEKNFKLINEDFLAVNLSELLDKLDGATSIKFTGSLPYNISKKIILKILRFNFEQTKFRVKKMSFIVQEEVAADYASKPPKASLLSNLTNLYAIIKKQESIPKSQFFPVPQVNGGILSLEPRELINKDYQEIEKMMKIAYVSPRKILSNNLRSSQKWPNANIIEILASVGLGEKARPSEVPLEMWRDIYARLINS